MKFLEVLKSSSTRFLGKSIFKVKKSSPEILIVLGTGLFVGTIIAATKATMKLDETLESAKETLEEIKTLKETGGYDEEPKEYSKDLTNVYFYAGWKVMKLYIPAVLFGATSLTCFYGAHGIMKKRNIMLIGACKAIEEGFNKYRNRVIEEFGEEKDKDYRRGVHEKMETVTYLDKDGKTVKKKVLKKTIDLSDAEKMYSFLWDETTSRHWVKSKGYNQMFMRGQQNYCNDLFRTREHVFLNEVLDALGLERVSYGALVGWIKNKGDQYIDFGIFNETSPNEATLSFVEEDERSVWVHLNVTGVIYDLI